MSELFYSLVFEKNILEVPQGISTIARDALDDLDKKNDVRVKESKALFCRGRGLNESQRDVAVQNLVGDPGPFQDLRSSQELGV